MEELKYNDLVYIPKEDFSYYRVMCYRPDKNGYLLECCDKRLLWGNHYKMLFLDQIKEKAITDISLLSDYWDKETIRLVEENKQIAETKFKPCEHKEAKIKDIQTQINKTFEY